MHRAAPARTRRFWLALLGLALILTLLALVPAGRLRLDSDLLDLLPRDRAASADYRKFLETFGGHEKIYVVVERGESTEPELVVEAAQLLADVLVTSPFVAQARHGPTEEDEAFLLEYVLPHAALLLDEDRLESVLSRFDPVSLRERAAWIKARISAPTGSVEAPWIAADPLGLAEELTVMPSSGALSAVDPFLGAFRGVSGRTALVIVTPAAGELDSRAGIALLEQLDSAYASVRSELEAKVEFSAVGGPLYAARDEIRIRSDVVRTVTSSLIVIGVLLTLYFGRPWIPVVLLLTILVAGVWTAALLTAFVGQISAISVSFAAILLGLGVDYGVHGAHQFRRTSFEGENPSAAMLSAMRRTGPAILASAATTVLAFAVLNVAHFRPLRELGWLVALGIVAILVASVTLGASLIVILSGRARTRDSRRGPGILWRPTNAVVERLLSASRRLRRGVLAAAVLLTLVSIVGVSRLGFDTDLRSLRPLDSETGRTEELLAEEFAVGLDSFSVVVEAGNLEQALQQAARAKQVLVDGLPERLSVWSPSDFIVDGERLERRIALLRDRIDPDALDGFKAELERQGFRPDAFSLGPLHRMVRGTPPEAPPVESWPGWLAAFVSTSEQGTRVALHATARVGAWPDGPPDAVVERLNAVVPAAAVASFPRVAGELRQVVRGELGRLGGWSLLLVVATVTLSFRGDPRRSLYALIPVGAGTLWLLGFCGAAGVPLGLVSVTAVPLLLGIGIDDGLHALQGEKSHGSLQASLRSVGPAMVVTSATTCVAFGSLILSGVPAVRDTGLIVCTGVLLCLVATLVLLPALERPDRSGGSVVR